MTDIVERLSVAWEKQPGAAMTKINRILVERRDAIAEITRLRQLLSEADRREREAREKALEEAAAIADKEAVWRERLFKANKHTDNVAKSAQSRTIADAIRAKKTEASHVTNQ